MVWLVAEGQSPEIIAGSEVGGVVYWTWENWDGDMSLWMVEVNGGGIVVRDIGVWDVVAELAISGQCSSDGHQKAGDSEEDDV